MNNEIVVVVVSLIRMSLVVLFVSNTYVVVAMRSFPIICIVFRKVCIFWGNIFVFDIYVFFSYNCFIIVIQHLV